jgi:Skp family chaperone for outer membrane proteins
MLLDKKNIYIGKSSSDITEDIIKLINEKFE